MCFCIAFKLLFKLLVRNQVYKVNLCDVRIFHSFCFLVDVKDVNGSALRTFVLVLALLTGIPITLPLTAISSILWANVITF